MKTFVISLPDAHARRQSIRRQFDALEHDYEIVDAVRGRALTSEERGRLCDEQRFRRLVGRSITPGELGCALSHLDVYRRVIADRHEFALVLEDDAWLSPNVPELLRALERFLRPDRPELVLLSWADSVASRSALRLWSGYMLVPALSGIGSHAYVVTRSAAENLLERLFPVRNTADCWRWASRHGYVRLLAVTPPPACLDLAHGSDIAPDVIQELGQMRPGIASSTARKFRRAWWRLADELEAAKDRMTSMRSKRRHVA